MMNTIANPETLSSDDIKTALAESKRIGRQIYTGFNERKLDLWNDVIASDVELRSTVGSQPIQGLEALKTWAAAFQDAFQPRIDLVDEILWHQPRYDRRQSGLATRGRILRPCSDRS